MNDNITPFTSIKGGGGPAAEPSIPESTYAVYDVEGNEHIADGFLVFTSHHVAIMRDIPGLGALPVLVVPLHRVTTAELVEDAEDEDSAPF